jgi:hypothetical protein
LGPLRYAAAVEGAYTHKLGADRGYTGLICKNPLHNHWDVIPGPEEEYTLGQLAEYVPNISQWREPRKVINTSLGRNCQLFDWLRNWAYRNINSNAWDSLSAWNQACLQQAEKLNAFSRPLPYSEIIATSKSIAKWTWRQLLGSQQEYIDRTHTTEIQAARGRRSGVARRKGSLAERKPWEAQGVSRATWYRRQEHSKRGET